jgi:hypothetical protein
MEGHLHAADQDERLTTAGPIAATIGARSIANRVIPLVFIRPLD